MAVFSFGFFFFICWLGRGVLAAVGKKQTKNVKLFFSFLFFSFFGFSLSVAITPSTRLSARPMSFVDRLSHSLGRHHCRRLFLGIAFRRTRGNSHGSRSRDSAVPIPARRGSTYPLAIVRILKHKAHTRGSSFWGYKPASGCFFLFEMEDIYILFVLDFMEKHPF